MRRPIIFPGFFYCAGIILAFQIAYESVPTLQTVGLILSCGFCIALIIKYFDFSIKELIVFALCLALGFGNLALKSLDQNPELQGLCNESHEFLLKVDDAISYDGEKIKLDCLIVEIKGEGDSGSEIIEQDKSSSNKTEQETSNSKIYDGIFSGSPKIRTTIYDKKASLKDFNDATIKVSGKLSIPKSNTNPYCFNYKTYLKTLGIDYTLSANKCEIVSAEDSFKRWLLNTKEEYLEFLANSFNDSGSDKLKTRLNSKESAQSSEAVDMIRGMVFGDKSKLDDDVYRSFRDNGTAHILAVSGLHVGLIFAALRKLLKKRNRKLYYVFTALTLIGYGIITQWSVSVVRAVVMIAVVLIGEILHRRYDMLSGAMTAGIILLLVNPFQLFNCGFQMSFLAVLGIAFLNKGFARHMPGYFAMITSVQLVLLPYMAFQFNYVSISAFIINYPTTFLVGLIVPGILVLFLLFGIFGLELVWVHQVLIWITDVLIELNTFTDSMGIGSFDVVSPPLMFVLFFIMATLYGFSEFARIDWKRKKYARIVVCMLIIGVVSFGFSYDRDEKFDNDNIVFVDVGQGDCVNVKTQNGNYIFDSGGTPDYNLGEKTLKPYLLKNSEWSLDGSFITHNHTDHFKGGCELSQVYSINKFYFSKNYQSIKEELEKNAKADEYEYLDNSQKVILDEDTSVEILWPKAGETNIDVEDENKNSMVMKVTVSGISILITGDIDSTCEKNLVEYYKGTDALSADILKVPHHGSKNSSSEEFLKAVNPKVAVIQVGKNTYGHPTQEALDRLKNTGAKIYRTDEVGAVGVEILGENEFSIDCCLRE